MWIDADSCKPKQDTEVLIAYDDVIVTVITDIRDRWRRNGGKNGNR